MVRVTLIESNKILSSFDSRLQTYAEKKIRARDHFNLIKATVTSKYPGSVYILHSKQNFTTIF